MWAQSHTQSPMTATQSRCIALCLLQELKNLPRNSTFPTHKYTTVSKGEASSLLLSFCLFSISHKQMKLPRPPNKPAALLSLAAPAPGQLWDGVPILGTAPELLCPSLPCQPGLSWEQQPNSAVALALLTQLLAQGHTRITQPKQPTCFTLHNQNTQTPKSSGTLKTVC